MAKRVYILTDLMRSSKSGYFIQGTDIQMDYPDAYPLPMETEVLENGVPVALRLLPTCGYLEREKQIKNGFPDNYKWTQKDRQKVTFKFRRLELDDKRDKIYVEYVERAGWLAGNEDRKARDTTKTIYERFDEDAILDSEIEDEALVVKAKNLVLDLEDPDIRNLYRLSNPGKFEGLVTLKQMKRSLLDIAEQNPTFIVNGIKSNRDKLVVLVSRALETGIVSLDFPGAVAVFNPAKKDWENLINASDIGGQEEKLERLIDHLNTETGANDLAVIEKRVETVEMERERGLSGEEAAEKAAPAKPVRKR